MHGICQSAGYFSVQLSVCVHLYRNLEENKKNSNLNKVKVTLRSVAGIMHSLKGHYQVIFRA